MLNTELQARFARSCADAAFGYARASTAAYTALANQTLEFWADAARASSHGTSQSGAPRRVADTRGSASVMPSPFDLWPNPALEFWKLSNPWAAMSPWSGASSSMAQHAAFAPIAAWWGMVPLRGTPACWPAAFALMTAGVPSSVAWPTAEANAAAMDAAEVATESLNNAFASYRSTGGHALAQIVSPRKLMAAFWLAPFGASMAFPWPLGTSGTSF